MRCVLAAVWILLNMLRAGPMFAAFYYVDPLGSDSANGSASLPWQTIQHAANQVVGGDVVLIQPGVYRESVVLSTSGTAENPILFAAVPGAALESPDASASLSAFDVQAGVGHLILLGVEARGGFHETIVIRNGAHDVRIVDCNIHGNRVGIWISGASAVEVDGCWIHHNSVHGLRVAGQSRDITVRRTTSEANDDGFGCGGDADGFAVEESSTDVRFVGCRALANGEDGFDLQGDRIELQASESRDNTCAGVKLYQNARIENSLVVGNQTGISTTSIFNPSGRIEVFNSTIADNSGTQLLLRGPEVADSVTAVCSVSLRNNIVSGFGKAVEALASVDLSEDHNILFRPDTTSGLIVLHLADGTVRRFSGQEINEGIWKAESGQGQGTLAIEPAFDGGPTYAVAMDGAAVDSGSSSDAPATDRSGKQRPAGMATDIGPDEMSLDIANHKPWADPGPDRVVTAGARLHLRAYGSVDPDGDPLSFEWDLGDASEPKSGSEVWHVYGEPGEYVVTLTASDGTLQHSRSARVQVLPSPTATATPIPTATPSPTQPLHDSEIEVRKRGKRIRLQTRNRALSRRISVVVRNADRDFASDGAGHQIHLTMEVLDCPSGVTAEPPDFVRSQPGVQDSAYVQSGRRERAIAVLKVAPDVLLPAASSAHQCRLRFTASGPGIDPTPENNVAELPIQLIGGTRR